MILQTWDLSRWQNGKDSAYEQSTKWTSISWNIITSVETSGLPRETVSLLPPLPSTVYTSPSSMRYVETIKYLSVSTLDNQIPQVLCSYLSI